MNGDMKGGRLGWLDEDTIYRIQYSWIDIFKLIILKRQLNKRLWQVLSSDAIGNGF